MWNLVTKLHSIFLGLECNLCQLIEMIERNFTLQTPNLFALRIGLV